MFLGWIDAARLGHRGAYGCTIMTGVCMIGTMTKGFPLKPARTLAGNSLSGIAVTMAVLMIAGSAGNSHSVEGKASSRKQESRRFLKPSEVAGLETNILKLTNEERVRHGLKQLQSSDALNYLAKNQSHNMCESKVLAHENEAFPEGWKKLIQRLKMVKVRSGAENVALRTVESDHQEWAREVVKGWMKSPSHRKNILEPMHRYLGVGVAPCENRIAYATQVFSPDPGSGP